VCQGALQLHQSARDLVPHRGVALVVVGSGGCAVVARSVVASTGSAGRLCRGGGGGGSCRSVASTSTGAGARRAHDSSLETGLCAGRPRGAGNGGAAGACQRHGGWLGRSRVLEKVRLSWGELSGTCVEQMYVKYSVRIVLKGYRVILYTTRTPQRPLTKTRCHAARTQPSRCPASLPCLKPWRMTNRGRFREYYGEIPAAAIFERIPGCGAQRQHAAI
jgi:hypothetical protein